MLKILDAARDSDEWETLVPDDPHYSPAYYRAFGGGHLVIMDGKIGAVVQPFRQQEGNWIGNAYNYGGPIGPYGSAPRYREEFGEWKNKAGVNERCTLCPFLLNIHAGHNLERREVVLADLTAIKLRSTTRHMVEKAQRNKAKVNFFGSEDLTYITEFERMYQTAMSRKKAREHWVYPDGFFYKVLKELGPSRSTLVITSLGDVIESGCLLIFNEKVCYYHWAATHGIKRDSGANHFQVWSVMNWAQDRGMSYVHLGGGLTPEKDSLWTFKTGFSPITRTVFSYTTTAKGG